MIALIKRVLAEFKAAKEFREAPEEWRQIVFYAEGAHDWPHFEPIVKELIERQNQQVSYLTSQHDDPILKIHSDNLRTYAIGKGTACTTLFRTLPAEVFVMTLPELEKYNLKRSTFPVHYAYIFHSINSTHMVYREKAFDGYDTIFCVGPHHRKEVRKAEELYSLPEKTLFDHGYGRLDAIYNKYEKERSAYSLPTDRPIKVLFASSWGKGSAVESEFAPDLIDSLLREGFEVVVRLHPMTVRHKSDLVASLKDRFADNPRFAVEDNMMSSNSFVEADVMISDWSGAAYEFAFGLGRPVLYIDTPPKANNPHYQDWDIEPLEFFIRNEIGKVLDPAQIDKAGEYIREMTSASYAEACDEARAKWVYNVGNSGQVAANELLNILRSKTANAAQA